MSKDLRDAVTSSQNELGLFVLCYICNTSCAELSLEVHWCETDSSEIILVDSGQIKIKKDLQFLLWKCQKYFVSSSHNCDS